MALSVFLKHLQDSDSITSLGRPFQCLVTPSLKKFFLLANLNLPWHSLKLCSLVLIMSVHIPVMSIWQPALTG